MHGETANSILGRLINPDKGGLPKGAAESILRIAFPEDDQLRIQELADRNTEGQLTPDERNEYEGYVLVGELISLLQAMARRSLQQRPTAA
jgi:hypothetical protein